MHALQGGVTISADSTGNVGIRGARRCASPWACVICSPTIAEVRAAEIDRCIDGWSALGGSVVFITATMQHTAGTPLADSLDALQAAWSAAFRFSKRPDWYGGQIRAVEVTHGRNGWHAHIHALVFIEEGFSPLCVWDEIGVRVPRTIPQRYADALEAVGFSADVSGPGWDVRPVTVGDGIGTYVAKIEGGWGAGLEIARADMKRGKRKGRTPFQLLEAAANGDDFALMMWRFYEEATAGRRRIVRSPGLFARCGVEELTDDEAAEGEAPELPTMTLFVPADAWEDLLFTGESALLLTDVARIAMGEAVPWLWPRAWVLTGFLRST